jgi:5-methylcytosine-specific restriction protein A
MRNPKWHRDEIILALDLYFDKNLGPIDASNPKIIALSEVLNTLPLFSHKPEKLTFRNPNSVTLKLANFRALDASYVGKGMQSYSRLDSDVFIEFSSDVSRLNSIANQIKLVVKDDKLRSDITFIGDDEISGLDIVMEGQVLYRMHKLRERDKKITEAKKKKVLKELGELKCEACSFNFEVAYGRIGTGFIECHHLIPLSEFEVNKETKLEDLALLCSNCHKMIHRDLSITSIKEFKASWPVYH